VKQQMSTSVDKRKKKNNSSEAAQGLLVNEAIRRLRALGIEATPRQMRLWDPLVAPSYDGSNYRRFTNDDLDKAVFIFILNRVLKIPMERIRDILVILKSDSELSEILEKTPEEIMTRERDLQGKESWRLKRELRDGLVALKDSLHKFKAGLDRFEELFQKSAIRLHQHVGQFREKHED